MKLEIKNIEKSYGKRRILSGASLECESGECIGILGKNGSGKSTLFGVLTGLCRGTGQMLLDGEDLMLDKRRRYGEVGLVPQSPPLIPELSAADNLSLWYTRAEMKKELSDGVLSLLGIGEFLKTPVSKMSGGMKKRLAIGCAVARRPSVLLLDEMSAALDMVCRENIWEYLLDFRKKGGIVILATHDVYELSSCDRLFVLRDGRLTEYTGERDMKALAGLLL
ncbi:MAG: ABC transporter ATP-binding protein [Clostridia bacterium]|nr:ABC transporter ATP-binding protein [Clostridia bacterium]